MKNKTYIIISIMLLILVVVGVTLALVLFRSETIDVNLNFGTDLGGYINYSENSSTIGGITLTPGTDYTTGSSSEIELWKKENAKNFDIYGHLYLDIDAGNEALLNSPALKWAVVSNNILLGEGNFNGYEQGDSIPVLSNHKLLLTETNYTVYVWVDENESIDVSLEGENFSVSVRCEATSGEYNYFGTKYEYDYTGTIETLSLPAGTYKLEAWGAEGGYGYDETYPGGYGGYSAGLITFTNATPIYIVAGGAGNPGLSKVATLNAGGYNGGGNTYGTTARYTGSGGGASHIALSSGIISELSNDVNNILIVAGGGGAGAYQSATAYGTGGNGGGYIGNSGTSKNTYKVGTGGTQSTGGTGQNATYSGSFGQGGSATSNVVGGGGGYYGGGAGYHTAGSGGGSGYIGNPILKEKSMYCYECSESSEIDTLTKSTTEVNEIATSNQAKKGNGYVRITDYNIIPFIENLERKEVAYGTNYDFKANILEELPEGYTATYSTYDNANTLSIGEYQIRYIAKNTEGIEFRYYQKIEIVGA